MKRTAIIVLIALFTTASVTLCRADEAKDHICFRTLDTDKDGMVTFQEFEKSYENEKEKFDQADEDKDGKLTHEEYHDLLGHGSS
jgi:Ca2+-binding EF-hand superfamily protein